METSSRFLLVALLLLFGYVMGYSNTSIHTDTSALIALKSRIKSDPQNILLKNWTTETSVCSWIGVACDSHSNRVSELNVSFMRLVGTIPSEIGNLSSLVSLDMNGNYFHGPIPPSIFTMPSLQVLFLRNNNLSSSLPNDMCKHGLRNLKRLQISFNELYGEIPSTLDQCSQLEYLSLFSNNFSGHIPREIGNITLLQTLYLGYNNLKGNIPKEIDNLDNLEILWLNDNNFSGSIPRELGNMTALRDLRLSNNILSGRIPASFGNLSNMNYLTLSSNKLNGEIPFSICNMSSLQYLILSNNTFQGTIPQCFQNLRILFLHLNQNNFTGLIPSPHPEGCRLVSINLNGNKLGGRLPQSLNSCKTLHHGLDVGNNGIQDTFPFWLETLPKLKVLVLRSNKFYGGISSPETKLPFPKLQVLDISQNEFTGSLSRAYFDNFRAMIDVEENETDEDEEEEEELSLYMQLTITFKGSDQFLERLLSTLTAIDLSSNDFSGRIPDSIGNLHALKYLNFSHNKLVGNIPASVGNVSAVELLDFSANRFDGEIPATFTRLTFLSRLNLSLNNLVGKIPESTQFDTFENDSYIGNSGLCGPPLTRKCNEESSVPGPEDDDDPGFVNGFGWQSVALGYGFGFVVGIGIGYCILRFGRPKWFLKLFFGYNTKMKTKKRRNRAAPTQRRG